MQNDGGQQDPADDKAAMLADAPVDEEPAEPDPGDHLEAEADAQAGEEEELRGVQEILVVAQE